MHLKALEALYFWPFVVSAAVGNSSFSAFLWMGIYWICALSLTFFASELAPT